MSLSEERSRLVAQAKRDWALMQRDVSTAVALYRRTLYSEEELPIELRMRAADKLMEYARTAAPEIVSILSQHE
jgi:hypothetical protein